MPKLLKPSTHPDTLTHNRPNAFNQAIEGFETLTDAHLRSKILDEQTPNPKHQTQTPNPKPETPHA